jgi:glycosyltransferase involved in cell wall biosynthesis
LSKVILLIDSNADGAAWIRVNLWKKGLDRQNIKNEIIYFSNINASNLLSKIIFYISQVIRLKLMSNNAFFIVYFPVKGFIFKLLNKKYLIIEHNEFPIHLRDPKTKFREDYSYYSNASKFVSCSDELLNFYNDLLSEKCGTLKISSVVEYDMFCKSDLQSPFSDKKYIVYCGNMGSNKDGVEDLISAFSLFSKKNKSVDLCLIGSALPEEMIQIKTQIKKNSIVDRVLLTGKLPHKEIPPYLLNAQLLVLARPNNKQAQGGFPSKLAEYLSSGVPVLVTKVGEIPFYIKDELNGYLTDPSDVIMLANKFEYILNNYKKAKLIGKRGQVLAKNEFDLNIQTERLVDFLKS